MRRLPATKNIHRSLFGFSWMCSIGLCVYVSRMRFVFSALFLSSPCSGAGRSADLSSANKYCLTNWGPRLLSGWFLYFLTTVKFPENCSLPWEGSGAAQGKRKWHSSRLRRRCVGGTSFPLLAQEPLWKMMNVLVSPGWTRGVSIGSVNFCTILAIVWFVSIKTKHPSTVTLRFSLVRVLGWRWGAHRQCHTPQPVSRCSCKVCTCSQCEALSAWTWKAYPTFITLKSGFSWAEWIPT